MDQIRYERLKKYCTTDEQLKRLKIVKQLGSGRKAAKQLGISKTAINNMISRIEKRAARKGDSPDDDHAGHAAQGYFVERKTLQVNRRTGELEREWVKTRFDPISHDRLVDMFEEASDRIGGIALPRRAPQLVHKDILAIYPYGDPHIGMYAWHGDAEADFDLNKAVHLMTEATKSLVQSAPPAENALICFLGDFYHADNQSNETSRGGNQLDVDSRWQKVFQVGVDTAVSLIELAKQKHKHVHVIVEIGNHDDHSALALAVCLSMFFRNDQRVTIDQSGQHYHYYRFGKNLIGVHHGHLAKAPKLPLIMATDRPKDWGETTHRVWYTGHIHTQNRHDFDGCEVESFRILPPRDAWSQSMGFRSCGRSMDCIVRHKEHGEIARHTVRAEALL